MSECVKSSEQIKDWLNIYFKRTGSLSGLRQHHRALPFRAFLRHLNLNPNYLTNVRNGKRPLSARYKKAISRFIDLWEGGYFEVVRGKFKAARLVRLTTPKHPRYTYKVTLEPHGPRLALAPVANRIFPSRHLSPFPT